MSPGLVCTAWVYRESNMCLRPQFWSRGCVTWAATFHKNPFFCHILLVAIKMIPHRASCYRQNIFHAEKGFSQSWGSGWGLTDNWGSVYTYQPDILEFATFSFQVQKFLFPHVIGFVADLLFSTLVSGFKKYPYSLPNSPYAWGHLKRKSCGLRNIRIHVDGA